jgi:hypothetical protein
MSTIIMQIMLAFNMMVGSGSNYQTSEQSFFNGNNNCGQQGIVIIDGDELGGRR